MAGNRLGKRQNKCHKNNITKITSKKPPPKTHLQNHFQCNVTCAKIIFPPARRRYSWFHASRILNTPFFEDRH